MLPATIDYDHGITCIDTEQQRPGMACCYLVESGGEYAFVECGTSLSVPGFLRVLAHRGIARERIAYVMPTHVHLDHAGGAGLLLREAPRAQLVIHPRGLKHLLDPKALIEGATAVYGAAQMAAMYGEVLPVPEARTIVAEDGFGLDFNGRKLHFMDAPGHARHHYALWDVASRGWFTGDTFGISYRELDGPRGPYLFPTTTPVQFEPAAWRETLERFLNPPDGRGAPDWMYLTHYGRVGDVARLAANLRDGIAAYERIARQHAQAPAREAAITAGLAELAARELAGFGSPLSPEQERELLAFDMQLNAQGLAVWLDRSARAG